jgi:CHAT domain-containing protein
MLFQMFFEQYKEGDLFNAEATLYLLLESNETFTDEQLSAVYSNLGAINILLGKYNKALAFNNKAEALVSKNQLISSALGDIYINRARIYSLQKSYNSAIEYFEKGIRIYSKINDPDRTILHNISSAYLNIGIAYYGMKDFKTSQKYLDRSAEIKIKYNLGDIPFVYLNLAKTFAKTKENFKAEEFFLKSISSFRYEFGDEYYRMAEAYFDYGLFLRSEGKIAEALNAHRKALSICLKNYGEKHTLVSLSYNHLGDDYMNKQNYDSALYYYQKSLIAVAKDFNNPDILSNPSIDSSLFDIRLLDNLKSKAQVLELFAGGQKDMGMKINIMRKSLETIELALQLIERIRNNYLSEESRIYLAENEKETYLFATHVAYSLYLSTHEISMGDRMYGIAQKAKAALLRNEITGNEILYSAAVPDSLREEQNRLTGNIAAYNNLILEENRKTAPDSNKITLWKDALFEMNREKEKVTDKIMKVFPRYSELIRKTEPVPVQEIRRQLKRDETIIDYLLSNQYIDGKRKLYIFLISRNRLEFRESWLDSLFVKNAGIIRRTSNPSVAGETPDLSFRAYTGALNYMYLNLIQPVGEFFAGKKLIIIPDEEIGWLSFDAFLKDIPRADQTDYEGFHFLINDYTFSYGYSSSLIFSKSREVKKGAEVIAFSPDYLSTSISGKALSSLAGTDAEIRSVFRWFSGRHFKGEEATKTSFLSSLNDPAIFHLAMHSITDSVNSKYSYLMFDTHSLSPEDGKLYNYEISLTRIKSPMVVLSACNSGTGTLYSGEGLMSLARSFTLAGASSVVKTAWEINDEASAAIMTRFYWHLSKGKEKNEAMRLAKLEYLKGSSPSFSNPWYWAAYEVLGDYTPVVRQRTGSFIVIAGLVMIFVAAILLVYFKRRNIFSARSR